MRVTASAMTPLAIIVAALRLGDEPVLTCLKPCHAVFKRPEAPIHEIKRLAHLLLEP
jgi:hypothetical protein